MRAQAFLGIMSAQKVVWADVPAYPNPVLAAEGGANALPSDTVEKGANTRPGPPLEGGYASRTAPDGFANVKECAAEPAAAAEGDVHAGASTVGTCRAGAGMAVQATVFAAVETALGLARLPDLLPPAYRSVYLQERLPLAWPMRSIAVFPPTGPCVCFEAFLGCPMRSAVSAQVF